MGGYGVYVWGSVLMTVVLLWTECRMLRRRRRAALRRIQSELPGKEVRREATT
ncbi:TPA: heme exporter protein CcmD [Stenotrophomonas maltophilia]|nr:MULTISPECIES: heme exporter protein CcmD [Pseudomonadota]MCD5963793.1 heme exporter protein CcmD [Stenotrophomonas maltophilia]MCZ8402497.1 heme exporter protein CcmD [Achromobacter xylosoxidans]MDF8362745.1 heme exporter protein CcmD [Achromobacter anxifer]MDH2049413.1 heme exporter protein CcmD [Achromobacter marplatensis]MDN3860196.1 heme exporter protein CcmD [Pseudomonas aeruginosa]